MFKKNYRENQNTFLCSITFPPENRAIYEIMWKKIGRARQSTGDNMAHAHCMLDN